MTAEASAKTAGLLAALVCTGALSAQQRQPAPATETASFEVVSVKPNKSGTPNAVPPSLPNGGYSASTVALKSVIANAYQLRIFQIEGGPDWLTSDRFDIIARAPVGTPDRLRPAMLRTLLAERFKLVAHLETRDQPLYALVVLRSDGRLGPRLRPAAANPDSREGSGFPMISVSSGTARITGSRVTLDNLARALASSVITQPVIDRSGLKGEFDLDLQFAPDTTTAAPEFPSIFTAVQEQLGLKLQAERGPVSVLVIDSVERPTAD